MARRLTIVSRLLTNTPEGFHILRTLDPRITSTFPSLLSNAMTPSHHQASGPTASREHGETKEGGVAPSGRINRPDH